MYSVKTTGVHAKKTNKQRFICFRYNSVIEGRVFSCRLHIYIERMSFEAALVLFGCTALIHIVNGASTEEYKRLQKSLMVNYSTSVRPVLDQNRPVLVNTALYLSGIDEVDAVGQRLVTSTVLEVTWLDEFLRWDLNSTGIQTLHFKQVIINFNILGSSALYRGHFCPM